MRHRAKFREDRHGQTDGCRRHLGFSKVRNFYLRPVVRGQYASSCQISSKSVERLRRCGDLTVFKIVAVRHLGFLKFKFLTVNALKTPILHCVQNVHLLLIFGMLNREKI